MRGGLRARNGFTLVEMLIVVIVVGILAAIAIPMYVAQRDKAKQAALKLNARNVMITAHSYVADSLNTSYQATHALTNGTLSTYAATYVSSALEENIKRGGAASTNAEGYRNPCSGKTMILNQAALPTGANVQPVLWITNNATYRYATFPTTGTQAPLAGSVVACWNTATSKIEIFSVDKNGKKSVTCFYVPM